MISGKGHITPVVSRDESIMNPIFVDRLNKGLLECNNAGYDAFLYEGVRNNDTQSAYYALGRTVIPPMETVTNASDAMHSWHFYGLAGDIISKSKEWDVSFQWMQDVADILKGHGLDWGGLWIHPDYPHYQFGGMKKSPSDEARATYATEGLQGVWKAVGAI